MDACSLDLIKRRDSFFVPMTPLVHFAMAALAVAAPLVAQTPGHCVPEGKEVGGDCLTIGQEVDADGKASGGGLVAVWQVSPGSVEPVPADPIPEPSALLLIIGAAGLILLFRRV